MIVLSSGEKAVITLACLPLLVLAIVDTVGLPGLGVVISTQDRAHSSAIDWTAAALAWVLLGSLVYLRLDKRGRRGPVPTAAVAALVGAALGLAAAGWACPPQGGIQAMLGVSLNVANVGLYGCVVLTLLGVWLVWLLVMPRHAIGRASGVQR